MKAFALLRAASAALVLFPLATFAQPGLLAGGGFLLPRADEASVEQERGYRMIAGLQAVGENLGVVLQGGHGRFSSRGTGLDPLSRHETRVNELHVLPKFYLRAGSIAAYFIGGGGPQWTTRETRPGNGGASFRRTTLDAAFQAGFGVEAAISETWAIGLGPTYHVVHGDGDREFEYAAFTVYLKL